MSLTGRPRIDQAIDRICAEGCRAVSAYLLLLARGESHPLWGDLNEEERRILRGELEAIMAVYGDRCDIDS